MLAKSRKRAILTKSGCYRKIPKYRSWVKLARASGGPARHCKSTSGGFVLFFRFVIFLNSQIQAVKVVGRMVGTK